MVKIGPDGNAYLVVGDIFGHRTKAENYRNSSEPDGTGGILSYPGWSPSGATAFLAPSILRLLLLSQHATSPKNDGL